MSIAIITGASSGIGREFALIADRSGAFEEIWLISRRTDRMKTLSESMSSKTELFPLDLTACESFEKIKERLSSEHKTVGLLINAAGEGKFSDFIRQDKAEINKMISLNVSATVALCRIALPYMRRGSRIINMSSVSGVMPLPGFNVYAATKAFVRSFTVALHSELKPLGITATAVCPYWLNTEFISNANSTARPATVNNFLLLYEPASVAAAAMEDSLSGKAESIPGMVSRLLITLSHFLPTDMAIKAWNSIRRKKTAHA